MIYVYINGRRMAYLKQKLGAEALIQKEDLKQGDTLVLPIIKRSEKELPLSNGSLKLSQLHGMCIYLPFKNLFIPEDNHFFYYMKNENLILENANLTALGLLFYLTRYSFSLYDIEIDILGGGRCGNALAKLLTLLHVKHKIIHHDKRNDEIDMQTYKGMKKGEIIINTAPICILEAKDFIGQSTKYIIDISSEKNCGKSLQASGVEVVYPGSLPEKYFPCSSADLIYEYMRSVNP